MLRLKGKEITPDTANAITQISRFISTLARSYHLDQEGKLFPAE